MVMMVDRKVLLGNINNLTILLATVLLLLFAVTDLDSPVEYNEVKEHEVWINFDVLDELDPSIRANIDLDYLAQLTNTDPALIEKYKVQQSLGNEEEDTMNQSWASSLNIHTLFSPARASVQVCLSKIRAMVISNTTTEVN